VIKRENVDICPDCGGVRIVQEIRITSDNLTINYDNGQPSSMIYGPVDLFLRAPVAPCANHQQTQLYWYFASCADCADLSPLPFDNQADRDHWIAEHTDALQHRVSSYHTTLTGKMIM